MSAVNEELSALFEDMAQLLERKGDLIFKIRAYQRAAEIISSFPQPLDALTQQGQDLTKVAGIGKAISGEDLRIHHHRPSRNLRAFESGVPRT